MAPPQDCTPLPILRKDQDPTVEPDCSAESAARKLYADTAPATAEVYAGGKVGSGFFVGDGSRFVTNAHVIAGTKDLITLQTHNGDRYDARIEKMDDINDLAVLQLEHGARNKQVLPIGSPAVLQPGDSVYALGHPSGRNATFISPGTFKARVPLIDGLAPDGDTRSRIEQVLANTTGEESADLRKYFSSDRLQTEMRVERGNSGGPVVDAQERAVGVATNGADPKNPNATWAVPSDKVATLLDPNNRKFNFNYRDHSMMQEFPIATPVLGIGLTALSLRFPRYGAGALATAGMLELPKDISDLMHAQSNTDRLYHGLSVANTLSLATGSVFAFLGARRKAYVALGVAAATYFGQAFVPHFPKLDSITRNDGADKTRLPLGWDG